MSPSNEYFDVESHGSLGVLRIKPHRGVALADISYSHAVLHAIELFESEGKRVLLVCVPPGNFDVERMDSFWRSARQSTPDEGAWLPRFSQPTGLPIQVSRQEAGVVQLLRLLRKVSLFKIIAVEGEVDFDLLGLLLAFDLRYCSRSTVFENRILDRGVTPGFGMLWYLAQHVGQPALVDLVLNRRALAAADAQRLSLVTHLSEDGRTAADAIQYAQEVATKPPDVLRGLAQATECSDFETYLNQVGGGFTKVPAS